MTKHSGIHKTLEKEFGVRNWQTIFTEALKHKQKADFNKRRVNVGL